MRIWLIFLLLLLLLVIYLSSGYCAWLSACAILLMCVVPMTCVLLLPGRRASGEHSGLVSQPPRLWLLAVRH